MSDRPTKQEILERFSAFLDAYDGDVEFSTAEPDPAETRRSGVLLQFVGKLKGWSIWIRKNASGIILAIVAYGGLPQGITTVRDHSRIAYTEAKRLISDVATILDDTEFYAFDPPDDWPADSDDSTPIRIAWQPSPTTTTTAAPLDTILEIQTGSGVAPGLSGYPGYA